jgi:hypothetical protein
MQQTQTQSPRWLAIAAVLAGVAVTGTGCISDIYEQPRPVDRTYDRLVDTRSGTPMPDAPPRPLPTPQQQPSERAGEPPIDSTGIRLAELPQSRLALQNAVPWQQAVARMSDQIDAPELRRNLHEGMSALAPRIARALMDYPGDTAVVSVAVFRDPAVVPSTAPAAQPGDAPASRSIMLQPTVGPATQPAGASAATPASTQPTSVHAALALAFEGFNSRLDGSFIPRVLADQPRTPDDGRGTFDPTLNLDRLATHYVLFRLTRDGMVAAAVPHESMRRQLAEAVESLPARMPSTNPATRPAAWAPIPQSMPEALQPGAADFGPQGVPPVAYEPIGPYDNGGYWTPQYYDDYAYAQPNYYWGTGVDPYLYGLYGCRWNSPFIATRAGWFGGAYAWGDPWWYDPYWGGGWGGGRRWWRDRDHNRDWHDNDRPNRPGNRPPIDTSTRVSTRGQVPWSRPPIVSPTNPPSAGSSGRGFEQPLAIPATPSRSSSASLSRDAQGRVRLGPAVDPSSVAGPTLGPARSSASGGSSTGSARPAASVVRSGSNSGGGSAPAASRQPMQLGPRVDPSRVAGPTLGPSRSSGGGGGSSTPRSISPSPSRSGGSAGPSLGAPSSGGSSSGGSRSGGSSASSGGSSGGSRSSAGSSGGSRSGGGSSGGSSSGGSSGGSRSGGGSSGGGRGK